MFRNILIIGRSCTEYVLSAVTKYIVNFDVDKIYVLSENHDNIECFPVNVDVVSSLDVALMHSDAVLLISQFENHRLHDIISTYSKPVFEMEFDNFDSKNQNFVTEISEGHMPTVLLLSIGEYTLMPMTELLLFSELTQKVSGCQILSPVAKSIMKQFETFGWISNEYQEAEYKQKNLRICSMHIDDIYDLEESSNAALELKKIKPDFLLVCLNGRIEHYEKLKGIILSRLGGNPDKILISPFVPVTFKNDDSVPLYRVSNEKRDNNMVDVSSLGYIDGLVSDIINKVSLPKGIHIII